MLDLKKTFEQIVDHLAPKLDTYELAIYLYLVRHSRLLGKREIVVSFDAKGTYIVENRVVTLSQMLSALRAAAEANPEQSVLLRADRGCSWEQGVVVMNNCRQAGLSVRIATGSEK